jgi:hypothetical protein
VVWSAQPEAGKGEYVALFNVGEAAHDVHVDWKELGMAGTKYKMRDLWLHKDLGAANAIAATIPAHGCVLYKVSD